MTPFFLRNMFTWQFESVTKSLPVAKVFPLLMACVMLAILLGFLSLFFTRI